MPTHRYLVLGENTFAVSYYQDEPFDSNRTIPIAMRSLELLYFLFWRDLLMLLL